jgi:hypothetical protein
MGKATSGFGRVRYAFLLPCGYQFAVSRSYHAGEHSPALKPRSPMMMSALRDHDPAPSTAPAGAFDQVEYVVRPSDDTWLIEHAGDRYGPYKNSREAMLFAIDAARKLGALGKNTRVRMTDEAGHALTTWIYGVDRTPALL